MLRALIVRQRGFLESCPILWRDLLTDIAKPTSVLGGIVSRPLKAGEHLLQLSTILEREDLWTNQAGVDAFRAILYNLRSTCPPIHRFLVQPALVERDTKRAVYPMLRPIINRLQMFCTPVPAGPRAVEALQFLNISVHAQM